MIERKRAGAVEVGEYIYAYAKWVEVVDLKPAAPKTNRRGLRHGVWLIVEVSPTEDVQLFYWTDEQVRTKPKKETRA